MLMRATTTGGTATTGGTYTITQFNGGDTWWNAMPGIVLNAAILLYVRSATARPEDDR